MHTGETLYYTYGVSCERQDHGEKSFEAHLLSGDE